MHQSVAFRILTGKLPNPYPANREKKITPVMKVFFKCAIEVRKRTDIEAVRIEIFTLRSDDGGNEGARPG